MGGQRSAARWDGGYELGLQRKTRKIGEEERKGCEIGKGGFFREAGDVRVGDIQTRERGEKH